MCLLGTHQVSVWVNSSPVTHTHLLRAGSVEVVEKMVKILRRGVQLGGMGQSHLRIFNIPLYTWKERI